METLVRDQLARDRTVLALERTILAYVRTALAFLASGVTTLHFLPTGLTWAGWSLVGLSGALMAMGLWRFVRTLRHLRRARGG